MRKLKVGKGMKLSELIPLIEQHIEEHGDLPVVYESDGCLLPVDELIIDQARIIDAMEPGTVVVRIC